MKKAALVLSGGGALGIAHIGVISELEKEYDFEWYAGVSAGSIIASLLAMGKTAEEIEKIIKETKVLDLLFDFKPSQFGFMSGERIMKVLQKIYGETKIESLKKPLFIGTTDFKTGERVTIKKGLILDAVRASISVPVALQPHWHKNEKRWLVDGGLTQNLPVDLALEKYKGDKIFAVDVGSAIDQDVDFSKEDFFGKGKSITQSLVRTIRIFFQSQQHFPEDPRITYIRPDIGKFFAIDVTKIDELIKTGKEAVKIES